MKYLLYLTLFIIIISGCAFLRGQRTKSTGREIKALPPYQVLDCELEPIKIPKLPKVIPGYTELDPETGLHMTGTVQTIDFSSCSPEHQRGSRSPAAWNDQIRCLPK
jgi:hypothetical protein